MRNIIKQNYNLGQYPNMADNNKKLNWRHSMFGKHFGTFREWKRVI